MNAALSPSPGTIARPVLTLPKAEAGWLREHYAAAKVIVEYGSGGSTVLAAEAPGTTIFSVESDRDWAANLQGYFDANPPAGTVHLHPVDIGKTEKWGRPAGQAGWRRFHRYPITVWDRPDFLHPDLVLIDGRFRAACLLTTMLRIQRPVIVLFDDYTERKPYHVVQQFADITETRGRMVRFDLTPRPFPVKDMAQIMEIFTRSM